ncbi:MAG: hypothetical protein E7246_07470 [Lachnoclostridium sp.]|nr:hypothetical protein [Lachnoclostridium sp.]
MSDYRRLISYIYEYEGKTKGKNIGFVKLEARNGQCRLNVNAKRVYVGGNAIGVYLLGSGNVKTFLGNMFVRNGCGEFRTTVDAANVEGSGNPLDTYYGLVVHDVKDSWRSYQTIWDDEKAMELCEEQEVQQESEQNSEQDSEEIQAAEVAEEITETAGNTDREESSDGEEESMEEGPSIESMVVSPELEDPGVLRYLQETEQPAPDPDARWQQMRKEYPKIQPFEYDGSSEVLAIRPDDIGKLPRENWVYGNNSFLLHGYYNYRYLILVRLDQENGQVRYLLGVPGHYYSNEKYMANMFGFPNFVLSKKQPPNDGRFGYWYTEIKLA